MSKIECSVPGCKDKVTGHVGKNDEYHFCRDHNMTWGYYLRGYLDKYYGNYGRHGRLNRKLWGEAMEGFLEHCQVEIEACTEIVESIVRGDNGASGEKKYDKWMETKKIPIEVSILELTVLANRLGINVDSIRNKHLDNLSDDLLGEVKKEGITQGS